MRARSWTNLCLIFLLWPVPAFLEREPGATAAAVVFAGMVAFAALYLRTISSAHSGDTSSGGAQGPTARWWSVAALYGVAAALTPALGELWVFAALFFLIAALFSALPRITALVLCGLTIIAACAVLPLATAWWIPLQAVVFTGAMDVFIRLEAANRALKAAHAETERLAVDNERLRFSRDLHDILGHALSAMTLKSQLAGRLVDADPARARTEIGDVEELSRQALDDVRDAVAGYRALSLDGELATARRTLAAAGVTLDVAAAPIPADAGSLLAWVVREGTTNVVRHSRARSCRIHLGVEGGQAFVEVSDDGGPTSPADRRGTQGGGVHGTGLHGSPANGGAPAGSGLRGLAERLEAAGGTMHRTRAPEGGFLLRAALPLGAPR
ncbi:sensor histidine kinase [Nonomuraea soli]|uniref:Two-component system sensor histidine kinase DesK n=1 Tax=Nonomuraea soli TaxID=1032476 RepID=A0A7W0CPT7_9ACTN|nr:sensor histidine kinase [Nonomuraea soli]MBA2895022.1 two-component system sensor histidine kinase DesK [Nonomuraea soli]